MDKELRALAAAILERTNRDLSFGPRGNGHDVSAKDYNDALAFLDTPWFSNLCAYLELDADATRELLLRKRAS